MNSIDAPEPIVEVHVVICAEDAQNVGGDGEPQRIRMRIEFPPDLEAGE